MKPTFTFLSKLPSSLIMVLSLYSVSVASEKSLLPLARIPDPPPAIDGTLQRFETIPGWQNLDSVDQVVFGAQGWKGPQFLSAKVLAAWDATNLYIAAKVKDPKMQQPYQASNLWQGSHVMLLLEIPRREPGQRIKEDIYHLGISPGDFSKGTSKAEVYRWQPKPGELSSAKVATQSTTDGYWIEAAIPWKELGLDGSAMEGTPLGMDIVISSSNEPGEVMQNQLMSLLTTPWKLRDPDRLVDAALADSNGNIDPTKLPQPAEALTEIRTIESGDTLELSLTTPKTIQEVKELILHAGLITPQAAGGTSAMKVFLNNKELTLERSRNRGETFELGVLDVSTFARDSWYVLYGPDFNPPPEDSPYAVRSLNPFEFRFDVSDLWLQNGENILRIEHSGSEAYQMQVQVAVAPQLSPKRIPPPLRPAPTGAIPTYAPEPPLKAGELTGALLPGGAVEVSLAGKKWIVRSAFSTPDPAWALLGEEHAEGWVKEEKTPHGFMAATEGFELRRTLKVQRDHVTVYDTLRNLSGEDVPILIQHEAPIGGSQRESVWLGGRNYVAEEMTVDEGENPTSLALTSDGGLGLLSEDDIMRAQANNFYNADNIGIGNDRFVLAAGKEVTLEFSIYPIERPDRFLFVNRVRQNWGVNRTIPGCIVILGSQNHYPGKANKKERAAYLENKNAAIGITDPEYVNGQAIHGNRYREISQEPTQVFHRNLRESRPEMKIIPYFHSFISNGKNDRETFANDAILTADGRQITYGNSDAYPLFAPVEGGAFARLQDELIQERFDELSPDGIYWDEYNYSQAKYQFSPNVWDGVSGDIDPRTHRLRRKISNVALLTQPWREKAAKEIMKRGILIGNGQPITRTFTQLKFPRFIETGSLSNLVKGQLGDPIALGDHLTEKNERDCYRDMVKGLDYGTVYSWYSPNIVATHPTLTHYMFPVTPLALGEGYLIAEERILTNRSGFFGWRDNSDFTAHVFDARGLETNDIQIPKVERDGFTFAEVRIPEGYSVALVRKKTSQEKVPSK